MKKKEKIILIAVFIVFICLISIMFFFHDNWRDEAQAYLLCRDMKFSEIFKNAHYEGHPILYYLILYPFVQLGVGPKIVNIVSLFFMSLSVYLILFHTKLNLVQKICFVVTQPVLYEFSVIGRSYSLLFFLLIVFSILYPKRMEKPILIGIVLGLLLNTHLLIAGFVMINAFCFYGYELFINKENDSFTKKKIIYSLVIFLLFCILLFLQFYPLLITNDGMSLNNNFSIKEFISNLGAFMFFVVDNMNYIIRIMEFCVVSYLIILLFNKDKFMVTKLMLNYCYMALLCEYIFGGVAYHFSAVAFTVLLCSLLMSNRNISSSKTITISLLLISVISIYSVFMYYNINFSHQFSDSYNTVKYIKKNISSESTLICNSDYICSALCPYLDNKFYHTNSERYFTYVIWDKKREQEVNFLNLDKFISENRDIYYIFSEEAKEEYEFIHMKKEYELKELYRTEKSIMSGEEYIVYKIIKKDI